MVLVSIAHAFSLVVAVMVLHGGLTFGPRLGFLQCFHGACTHTKRNSWWISYSWLNHFPPEVCGVMCGLTQLWLSEGWRGRVKHSPDSAQHFKV